MAITPLPTLDRTSATFRTDVDLFFGSQLPAFSVEAEAARSDIVTKQGQASTSATNAATSEGNALTYKNAAATSASNAATSETNALASQNAAAASAASITAQVAVATNSAPSKSTPVDSDEIPITDSAASFGLKKLTWVNLKATLKTYLDTLYAGNGANSNITSLSSLTTALSIAQGGTGAATANAAADAIGAYRKGTILGAVSQVAGVPTGAIIERGSNASGSYVRFADGMQICLVGNSTTSAGAATFTYPATFSVTPAVVPAAINPTPLSVSIWAKSIGITGAEMFAYDAAGTRISINYSAIIIGQWF